jgi:uncharacterized protein YndB with AHSA1/START domain
LIKDTTGQFAVDQTIIIHAPRAHVFKLITDPVEAKRWSSVTDFELRVGGHYRLEKGEWIAEGEVIEFDPPRVVAWTWDWKNAPLGVRTVVRFELTEEGENTILHLTHTGFAAEERAKNHGDGWTYYADRLKIAAEGGDPGEDKMGM